MTTVTSASESTRWFRRPRTTLWKIVASVAIFVVVPLAGVLTAWLLLPPTASDRDVATMGRGIARVIYGANGIGLWLVWTRPAAR